MNDPDFDEQGYPTDAALDRIATWIIGTLHDLEDAMDFAGRLWYYPNAWQKEVGWLDPEDGGRPCLRYVFSTGGWSGNESVVGAIEKNALLQMLGAWSWRRGGHYEYRFPIDQ